MAAEEENSYGDGGSGTSGETAPRCLCGPGRTLLRPSSSAVSGMHLNGEVLAGKGSAWGKSRMKAETEREPALVERERSLCLKILRADKQPDALRHRLGELMKEVEGYG